jgi:hypothetical protein
MSERLRTLCARASWAAEEQARKQDGPVRAALAFTALLTRWHQWCQRNGFYCVRMR